MKLRGKQRLKAEKDLISNVGRITVEEMSIKWEITEETARRDLDKLESEGLLTRVRGGAVWNIAVGENNIRYMERRKNNSEEKLKIAQNAVPLLKECQTIMADASSTIVEALQTVINDPAVTIITNSEMLIHQIGNAECTVISAGGVFNAYSMSFQGELTKRTLKGYGAKLTLIGCKGLSMDRGILDSYEGEAEIKKVMLEQSDEVALLADHTKFDQSALLKLADIDILDYLITDKKPSQVWIDFCEEKGIRLIY